MLFQRLLDEAQLREALWRIGVNTDQAALVQLVARGEGERFLALQMSEQCQAI
jgi:hypothetical protein